MAENDQEKTEEPSDKRVEEYREEGKIARSTEISTLMTLTVAFSLLYMKGDALTTNMMNALRSALSFDNQISWNFILNWVKEYFGDASRFMILFFSSVVLVSLVTSLAQTGIHFSAKTLAPKFSSINPMQGIKRLFASVSTLVQLFKNFCKVAVIGAITYSVVSNHMNEIVYLSKMDMMQSINWGVQLIMSLLIKIGIFLIILASVDYIYQWFRIHNQMKMTRQELKDEMKDQSVSPHVKSKIKQMAFEKSKKQIKTEVPKADVIITNPTHFAIAIRYKRGEDAAPRVVAKGQDNMAKIIRELAKENSVPLYEYPELARALYKKVKVGGLVPGELYQSVAQVLAYIYQLYRKRNSLRGAAKYVG